MTHLPRQLNGPPSLCERKFRGDCLEKIGVPDRGTAVIDRALPPRVGDLIHCTRTAGTLDSYLKEVVEIGEDIVVRTRYLDETRDFSFVAAELLGTVVAIKDTAGNILKERVPE